MMSGGLEQKRVGKLLARTNTSTCTLKLILWPCTYRVSRFKSPAKQFSPISLILLLWRCLEKQKQFYTHRLRFSYHDRYKIIFYFHHGLCSSLVLHNVPSNFWMLQPDLWIRSLYCVCKCRRLSWPNIFKVFSSCLSWRVYTNPAAIQLIVCVWVCVLVSVFVRMNNSSSEKKYV